MEGRIPQIERVVVIIVTRNRIQNLVFTISKCLEIGLKQQQIFITDDASSDGTPEILMNEFPALRVHVNERQSGYIHARNYMMKHSHEDFILSLDDDSNLMSREDLEEALQLLDSDEKFGVFGFIPIEQLECPPPKDALSDVFFFSTTYIGCGHIIKRSTYKRVGAYREEYIFYGEEFDFSIRCYKAGLYIIKKGNLIVHHRVDYKERAKNIKGNKNKGEYGMLWRSELFMANKLTRILLYYPLLVLPYYTSKTIFGYFYLYLIRNKRGVSYTNAIRRVFKRRGYILRERDPLTLKQFFTFFKFREN